MKKLTDILLNFIIILGLTFIIIHIFWIGNKQVEKTNLSLSFSSKSYNVPASPVLVVDNYTDSDLTLHTCNDISILKNGEKLSFSDDFCKQIQVEKKQTAKISYASEYKQFIEFWEYTMKAKVWEKEYISQIEIQNRWTIWKLFLSLVYAPIYNLVAFLITIFGNSFGWAIIAVTIIIRLALMYPQHKMMISQRKLQAIQPKIKEVQEKYKNDKQKLGVEIMNLYKKEKVNPFGSCGFLIIQMPILLVIYRIILGIQDPANMYYVYSFLSWFNVSNVNPSFFWLDLLQTKGTQWIILAVIVWLIQFLQIKLSLSANKNNKKWVVLEKKKWENDYSSMMPDPEMMNKFMLFGMPIMVWIFTYTLFAWVGIYWWISTLFMLVQQLIVNKITKK